jgi:GT2 family glycosyltransferase
MTVESARSADAVRLTVIIPATNRPATLTQCLDAIDDAAACPEQIIVVEDPTLRHPAFARNVGARTATGDVLVFVDADVTVHADAFVRIRAAFAEDPNLVALFGSYDDAPADPGTVSMFRNLLHHHVHQQHSAGPATTFWAGLGAIRRRTFESAGGFNEHPIEDIELGMRLSAAGARIVLDPRIQGTHLKAWSLWSMIRTDLTIRGIPWVDLLLQYRGKLSMSTLNLGWRHRFSALASLVVVGAVLFRSVSAAAAALALLVALNLSFYGLLFRRTGLARGVSGIALHVVHLLVGVAAVPMGVLRYLTSRRESIRQTAATRGL